MTVNLLIERFEMSVYLLIIIIIIRNVNDVIAKSSVDFISLCDVEKSSNSNVIRIAVKWASNLGRVNIAGQTSSC